MEHRIRKINELIQGWGITSRSVISRSTLPESMAVLDID